MIKQRQQLDRPRAVARLLVNFARDRLARALARSADPPGASSDPRRLSPARSSLPSWKTTPRTSIFGVVCPLSSSRIFSGSSSLAACPFAPPFAASRQRFPAHLHSAAGQTGDRCRSAARFERLIVGAAPSPAIEEFGMYHLLNCSDYSTALTLFAKFRLYCFATRCGHLRIWVCHEHHRRSVSR